MKNKIARKVLVVMIIVLVGITNIIPVFASPAFNFNEEDALRGLKVISKSPNEIRLHKVEEIPSISYFNADKPVKVYEATEVVLLPEKETFTKTEIETLANNDNYSSKNKPDTSGAIRIYTTVYYTEDNTGYLDITRVAGNIKASGSGSMVESGVVISSNKYSIGQAGMTDTLGMKYQVYDNTLGNSTRSWSYIPSWKPVNSNGTCFVGCLYTVQLKRGTKTWTTELSNNICSNGISAGDLLGGR